MGVLLIIVSLVLIRSEASTIDGTVTVTGDSVAYPRPPARAKRRSTRNTR